ncbi:MAG: hypothetical protein V3T16_07830 [Gemmatimonadales bacterium]
MTGFRWSTERYDQLESAVRHGRRVAIMRRGTEHVVTAMAIRSQASRDCLIGKVPMTGEELSFYLDELEEFQVID